MHFLNLKIIAFTQTVPITCNKTNVYCLLMEHLYIVLPFTRGFARKFFT
jgi:hypothetical protein